MVLDCDACSRRFVLHVRGPDPPGVFNKGDSLSFRSLCPGFEIALPETENGVIPTRSFSLFSLFSVWQLWQVPVSVLEHNGMPPCNGHAASTCYDPRHCQGRCLAAQELHPRATYGVEKPNPFLDSPLVAVLGLDTRSQVAAAAPTCCSLAPSVAYKPCTQMPHLPYRTSSPF